MKIVILEIFCTLTSVEVLLKSLFCDCNLFVVDLFNEDWNNFSFGKLQFFFNNKIDI